MVQPIRIVLSAFKTGLETYEKPFLLNNDAFPVLENALIWRRRIIKKPGALRIGRLRRKIGTTDGAGNKTIIINTSVSPQAIQSGISQFVVGSAVFTDPGGANPVTLQTNGPGTGMLDRVTTTLTLTGTNAATDIFYFPGLPVMGIEEFVSNNSATASIDFPETVYFDQTYAYEFLSPNFFDVSFYKTTGTPITWSGSNFQQFFSSNYYRAMWVTNNKPGMQFIPTAKITSITWNTATRLTFVITGTAGSNPVVAKDAVWTNEITTNSSVNATNKLASVNGQSGTVFSVVEAPAGTFTVIIDFPNSTIIDPATGDPGKVYSPGILQLLTTTSQYVSGDGIRWYDGFNSLHTLGFVNFAPPLDNTATPAYLVGCRMILPFGNRLIAIGTFEQKSADASATYFGNRIRYCEVSSTPFYASPVPAGIAANSFEPKAWVSNIQGFGGFIDLDTTERILSAAVTQGSLILGLESEQRRMSNTGIETDPFSLQVINPEFGTAGTYAVVPMDKGILSAGEYGFLTTSSFDSQRFDLPIIDQIFQVNANQNGFDRISGARDFPDEVIYFSYVDIEHPMLATNQTPGQAFPNQTVVYNYREPSFAIWDESYTTYGIFKEVNYIPWNALTDIVWNRWDTVWLSGKLSNTYPWVAGGTPQGYVMKKFTEEASNDPSMFIQAITGNTITSPNHNLETGMFVGFVALNGSGPSSGGIGQVTVVDVNTFTVSPSSALSGVSAGLFEMCLIDNINVQTKQFASFWPNAAKIRFGTQRYFLEKTDFGEFTVNLFSSQQSYGQNNPSNPNLEGLISSNIVRTRPDDSLGLNDAASTSQQLWHRLATSAIGDSIQLQFTMSNSQMLDVNISQSPWEMHVVTIDTYPSRILS